VLLACPALGLALKLRAGAWRLRMLHCTACAARRRLMLGCARLRAGRPAAFFFLLGQCTGRTRDQGCHRNRDQ
jgi:hypothetical protein